jgi:hypothetical protein
MACAISAIIHVYLLIDSQCDMAPRVRADRFGYGAADCTDVLGAALDRMYAMEFGGVASVSIRTRPPAMRPFWCVRGFGASSAARSMSRSPDSLQGSVAAEARRAAMVDSRSLGHG